MVQCIICKSSGNDELKYGKLITKKRISVHYFCLLLTSNLIQNGNDNQGILGFLLNDIKKEAHRIKNQICCYCGLESAGVGCCDYKCRRIFHLICGIENGAINQFSETYRSFCNLHIPKLFRDKLPPNTICSICYEKINVKHVYTMCCKSPCCKNGWFHKYCLQEFANNSGYFFKCPLCNNKDEFRELLVLKGIFVPDQDAAWELEPNAFSELLERPNECSAFKCLCRKGRKYNNSDDYEIIFCDTCGSQGIHVLCNDNANEFTCIDCSLILTQVTENENSSNKMNNSSSKIDSENVKIDSGDIENTFVVVDDEEYNNDGINAAEKLRKTQSNNSLETHSVEGDNAVSNHTIINLNNPIQNSNNYQQAEYKKRNNSPSEVDEIIQLTRSKKRKILSDSDENLEYKNINKINRSETPLFRQQNTSKSFKKNLESSDDNVPLNFLTNINSLHNNVILNKVKEESLSPDEIESKNFSKILTRTQSRCKSSDDSSLIVSNSNNGHRGLNLKANENISDSSRNSPILRQKNTIKSKRTAIESSEDNVPLTLLINKNSIENNIILSRKNDTEKEFNINNNISQQKVQIEKNSKINTNRSSRSQARRIDNNNLLFTSSKSRVKIVSSRTPSNDKPCTTKSLYSPLNFNSKRYLRDDSESSLSSADINLKIKIKSALENNAKNKQTPINRNMSSSKLKSNDDGLSSSATEKELNIEKNVFQQKVQIEKKSKKNTNRISRSRVRRFDNNNLHFMRSKSRDKIVSSRTPSNDKPCTTKSLYFPLNFNSKRYLRDDSESSLSSADINLKIKMKSALENNAKNKQTPINRNMSSSKLKSNDNGLSSSATEKEFNIEKNVFQQKVQIEKKSKKNTNRISRSRVRRFDNNHLHFMRSKSRDKIVSSRTPPNDKPGTSNFAGKLSPSPLKMNLRRCRHNISQSSLSSADIKTKCTLKNNGSSKQTPINQNISSPSVERFKSHLNKLQSDNRSLLSPTFKPNDDSLSSSSSAALMDFPTAKNSTANLAKTLRKRILRTTSKSSETASNTNEDDKIHRRSSRIKDKNCRQQRDSILENDSQNDDKIQSKTSSTESDSIRLRVESDSDSEYFVPSINKKYCNNKENTQCKSISKRNKKNIKRSRITDDKYRNNLEREYYEVVTITIRAERRNKLNCN